MAYDLTNLLQLRHMQELATKVKNDYATKQSLTALEDRVDDLVTAGGEPNVLEGVKVNGVALAIANKMVDVLIASGTANGAIAVNGKDVMVKGLAALAYKAKVAESDLDTALKAVIDAKAADTDVTALSGKVTTLIGSDANKSARTIANEELTKQLIPASAKESLNTLTEIAAWIQAHPDDASAMNNAITALTNLVGTLPEGATSATVVDYISEAITKAAYKHPTHTEHNLGLYKVAVDKLGHVSNAGAVTKADITALGIPAQDTTYAAATASKDGLMSAADKTKLDGLVVASNAEVTEMLNEVFAAPTA